VQRILGAVPAAGPPGPAQREHALDGQQHRERRPLVLHPQQQRAGHRAERGRAGRRGAGGRVQPGADGHRDDVQDGQEHRGRHRADPLVGQRQQHGPGQAADRRRQRHGPVVGTARRDQHRRQGGEHQQEAQLRPPLARDELDDAQQGHHDAGRQRDRQEEAAPPPGEGGRCRVGEQDTRVTGQRHRKGAQ
jgi:hypothetical protein